MDIGLKNIDPEAVKNFVFYVCSKNPALVPVVISAATEGVKEFAARQRDDASKMSAMLLDVLDENVVKPNKVRLKTRYFSINQIWETIQPWFGGTPFAEKNKNNPLLQ